MTYERALPYNFMGIEGPFSRFDNASVLILPVPYEGTTCYGAGTRRGPKAIIDASRSLELYDEEIGEEIYRCGIHTLPEMEPLVEGPAFMVERISSIVEDLYQTGKLIVLLGGEHTISIGAVRGISRYTDLSVLQIDAHADLRDSYQGSPYSHACVMRRVREVCQGAVQVGIRSISAEEMEFVVDKKLEDEIFFMKDIIGDEEWKENVIRKLGQNVYITIDLDGLDPAIMPAVGTPEPGGLGWYEVLSLLKEVAEARKVVGFDVVELAPVPGLIAPNVLAARLIYKLIGYILLRG
ncbi:agmatinase [Candidatus Poribacteria bacterium]|nr:agmatinase [Candidatus Poribacteria bacterium]